MGGDKQFAQPMRGQHTDHTFLLIEGRHNDQNTLVTDTDFSPETCGLNTLYRSGMFIAYRNVFFFFGISFLLVSIKAVCGQRESKQRQMSA